MRSSAATCVGLWLGSIGLGATALAQEGTWSISAAAGVSLLSFDAVDEGGQRDIQAFNDLGVAIGSYPVLRYAPLVELSGQYRFERDAAIAPFFLYQQARTSVSHRDDVYDLSLDRRLTAVLAGVDLLYYFPPLIGGSEVSVSVGLANLWATADQTTRWIGQRKVGSATQDSVIMDAYALHTKASLIVRAGVQAVVPFDHGLSVVIGARYQYAHLGTMPGRLRELDVEGPVESTVEFNYSALQFLLGGQVTF